MMKPGTNPNTILLTPPCHFPCRTNPLAIGVYPQTDQRLRIESRPPARTNCCCDFEICKYYNREHELISFCVPGPTRFQVAPIC